MVETEKFLEQKSLSCGMILKDPNDYEYFKAYFDNNRFFRHSCNSLRMNTKQAEIDKGRNIFAPDGDLFVTVLYYSIAILGIMIAVGIFCEGKRYYSKLRSDN